jgi:hypothetical protein
VQSTLAARAGEKMAMKASHANTEASQEILERKEAEFARALRNRDDIAIEKSADQMDEIQHPTERDMAIRNVYRECNLLRRLKAHCDEFTTVPLEAASRATRSLLQNALQRCPGPRAASTARRLPIGIVWMERTL